MYNKGFTQITELIICAALALFITLGLYGVSKIEVQDTPQDNEVVAVEGQFGGPNSTPMRHIYPVTDSAYEIGTSSLAFLRGTFDELCLTGDSCKTAWPTGGASGGISTTSPWTAGDIVTVVDNGTVTSSSTISEAYIDSSIARDSELHNAVTLAGQDYLTLSTQQITVGEIQPDDLASADFGDFTCNGTNCSFDTDSVAAAEITTGGVATAEILDDTIAFGDINFGTTLAANPALLVDECYFSKTAAGGGFICEGSTADTAEQLYLFPDVNGADTTRYIMTDDTSITSIDDTSLEVSSNVLRRAALTGDITASAGANTTAIASGVIVNADVNASAGIVYSKLSLTDSLLAADLDATNAEADDDIVTYDSGTGGFTFNSGPELCVAITGSADLCDGVDNTASGGSGLSTSTAIADTYIIYGTSASTVGAESAFTYDDATNKLTVDLASTTAISATTLYGALVGNADTATALAANGANCSAGSAPLGVDASGAVESCTDFEEDLSNEAGLYAALSDVTQFWEAGDTINSGTLALGSLSFTGTLPHENGGLEADVSGYTNGLYGQISGATADIDTEAELYSVLSDVSQFWEAGDTINSGTLALDSLSFTGDLNHEYGGLEANVSAYTGLIAISGGATSEVDSKAELEAQIADVSNFAEADGDVYSGVHDFGGATSIEIVNGTNPTVNASGEIAVNTTAASSSIRYYDGTAERALYPTYDRSFNFASSTLAYLGGYSGSATTSVLLTNPYRPLTLVSIYCKTDSGTALLNFGDGTNNTETVTCSSSGAVVTPSSNNTWNARENFYANVGTQSSNPSTITVTATLRDDAD